MCFILQHLLDLLFFSVKLHILYNKSIMSIKTSKNIRKKRYYYFTKKSLSAILRLEVKHMNGVIYARYSSDNQREESIEGQIRECTAYAEKNGISLIGTYIDRALTAKTDHRPNFQKMIKDSEKHNFDYIIVWKLDRFARNRYDSAHYKAFLKKHGVKVISATEAISEGAEGIILESVLEGMAEYYSVELAEKVIRGQTENALKCKFNGGTVPFGYIIDETKHFQIDPKTAPLVLEVYKKYDQGMTMTKIAEEFNNKGIKNVWGSKFNVNSISKILTNRRYIGEYRYRDVVIPDGIPSIVPKDLFDKIQQQIEKNKKAPARYKAEADYILTTKLYCGKCMSFMVGESGTSRNSTTYRYYKCITAKRKKGCDKKAVKKDWIEDIVIKQVLKAIWDDDLIEELTDMIMRLQDEESTTLPLLYKQLSETEKGISNLLNAIQQGIITSSTKKRLEELETQKSDIETNIAKEKAQKPTLTRDQIRFWFERFRKLNANNINHRKRMVDCFVNSVILYDDRIEFYFNFKEGANTLTIKELSNSSDMVGSAPPTKKTPNGQYHLVKEQDTH